MGTPVPAKRLAHTATTSIALVCALGCGGCGGQGTTAPAPQATGAPARAGAATAVADVRLELLRPKASDLPPSARNLFQFQARSTPSTATPQRTVARRVPALPVAPAVPIVTGPPPLPAIALRYIGVADTDRGRIAMLKEPGGDILSGREGDIIDGRYRLLRVGPDSADLAYADGRGRQTIRLSGQ